MGRDEARQIARAHLAQYRSMPYDALSKLIGAAPCMEFVVASSGVKYQIESQAFWDDKKDGVIRVMATISDGGCCEHFCRRAKIF